MVTLTQGRDLSAETLALADEIRDLRVMEVESMTDWLTTWGEPILETYIDHANGHSEGDDAPPLGEGMLVPSDVADLAALTNDQAFEEQWLNLMINHHQGAIDVAQVETERGLMADAVTLAKDVINDQDAETGQLMGLLDRSAWLGAPSRARRRTAVIGRSAVADRCYPSEGAEEGAAAPARGRAVTAPCAGGLDRACRDGGNEVGGQGSPDDAWHPTRLAQRRLTGRA